MTPLRRRARSLAAVLVLLAGPACVEEPLRLGPSVEAMARALGADVVTTLVRGHVPGRSGDIAIVPVPWNVVGQWHGGLRGEADPRTTHSTPWSYHQRVPLGLYGPGYVRQGARIERSVDVADLAPTLARLLGLPYPSAVGSPLGEALEPGATRPPAAIVTVVVDGGGWNVLDRWPNAWRTQRRLLEEGTTYVNATIGSAPSVTAPVHATIGTGRYPRSHGLPENSLRLPSGEIGDAAYGRADLSLLRGRTLADEWDLANANRAWVGMIGYEGWHLPMIGAGAAGEGADRDVAVLWNRDRRLFWTNPARYELPAGLPGPEALAREVRALDASDGAVDLRWRGSSLDPTSHSFEGSPALARYHGDAAIRLARTAPLGEDEITDLLFVELKIADIAGHVWNMSTPPVRRVLREQDVVLRRLVRTLDQRVGRGRYVLALTADHGQTPLPEESGGLRIDRFELLDDLTEAFGPVVEAVHPGEVYLDLEEVEDRGTSVELIARFIGGYRYRDGLPDGTDTASIPAELLDRRVFAGAIPGPYLETLAPADLAALGDGDYPEGDLTSPP